MPANPFDQFDQRTANLDPNANPFDAFDAPAAQPAPPNAEAPSPKGRTLGETAFGLTNALGQGTANGLMGLYGLPGGAEWLARKGINFAGGNVSEETYAPTYSDIKGAVERFTGEKEYKPQTTAEEYARTIGEFAPAIVGPGGVAQKVVSGLGGAVTSETAGQMTEGTAAEPWARIAGGLAGSLAPSAAARVITPAPAPARLARDVAVLKAEGVPLTAGDKTGSKALRWAESAAEDSAFAGPRAKEMREAQHAGVTSAALRRVGENADDWREALPQARERIGEAFNQFGRTHEVRVDTQLFDDLNRAHANYTGDVAPAFQSPRVERVLRDFQPAAAAISRGEQPIISGQQYSAWRSDLSDAAGRASDAETRHAINGIIDALDDALQRSAPAEAAEGIAEARRQYRHLETLTGVAARAGQDTAQGYLSASNIRNAINQTKTDKRYYTKGQGDFGEFARAAEAVIKPLPNSGTAPREAANSVMTLLGLGAGAALGAPLGLGGASAGAMAGALAPIAGKALAARTVMHPAAQAVLGNQIFPHRFAPAAGVAGTAIAAPAIIDSAEGDVDTAKLLEILMRRAAADRGQ
jgi:hypothetical protein